MNNPPLRVLLVEDDPGIAHVLQAWMRKHSEVDLSIDHAMDPGVGLSRLSDDIAAVILDLNIPPEYPMERTLDMIPEFRQKAPVIVLTGHSEGTPEETSKFISRLISECGAEFVFFKNQMTTDGMFWFFQILHAAMARRLYRQKEAEAEVLAT